MIKAALTVEDAKAGMRSLAPQIERYASLIVRKGVHVKPGQELVIMSPVETAEFARTLVRCAYEAGAGHVTVVWSDDAVTRLTYENNELSYFEQMPEWQRTQYETLAEAGACFVFVEGSDPEALKGIDPAKPTAASRTRNTQCQRFRRGLDFNINPWCIAALRLRRGRVTCFPMCRKRWPSTSCGAPFSRFRARMGKTQRARGSCTTRRSRRTCGF